jgi:5-methylthioadenosine/S-adenosylhomocysteine deaminase
MTNALYGWVDAMTHYTRHADADDIYWCTFHGALDFLNNGVTTAYDFSDSRLPLEMDAHGQRIPAGQLKPFEHAAQQIRAKADAGLRFIHSTLLNDEIGDVEETLARFGETKAFGDSLDSDLYLGTAISGAVQSNGGSTRRPAPSAPS